MAIIMNMMITMTNQQVWVAKVCHPQIPIKSLQNLLWMTNDLYTGKITFTLFVKRITVPKTTIHLLHTGQFRHDRAITENSVISLLLSITITIVKMSSRTTIKLTLPSLIYSNAVRNNYNHHHHNYKAIKPNNVKHIIQIRVYNSLEIKLAKM